MKTRIYVVLLMLVAAAVVFAGCNFNIGGDSNNVVRGTGNRVPHTIDADGFTGINISGAYDLTFQQASDFSVILEVHENLLEYLETEVRSGVLHVGFARRITLAGDSTPRLRVYAPYLDSLVAEGAVSANMELHVDRLDINIAGAANVNLVGSTNTLNIHAEGAADINSFDMAASDVTLTMEGAGNADIYASETLHVSLSGVGRVRYDGDATVTRNIAGLGSIARRS